MHSIMKGIMKLCEYCLLYLYSKYSLIQVKGIFAASINYKVNVSLKQHNYVIHKPFSVSLYFTSVKSYTTA